MEAIVWTIAAILNAIKERASEVANLGNWAEYQKPNAEQSFCDRVPTEGKAAPGFDAGLAVVLGIIPEKYQTLSATLHANYTAEAIQQVRNEYADLTADSETAYWLAMCDVCDEDTGVDEAGFLKQIELAQNYADNPVARLEAAKREYENMGNRYSIVDGVVYVHKDGGLQGAYIQGHRWGVQYSDAYGIWFIGTYEPTLGLEDFEFSDRKDDEGRPMSGPVHGSTQFVKVSSFDELAKAIKVVKNHFA